MTHFTESVPEELLIGFRIVSTLRFYHKTLLFFVGAAATTLAASGYLFYEIEHGVRFSFSVTMAIAATVGLLLPLFVVALMQRYTPIKGTAPGWVVFFAVCVLVGGGFTLSVL